MGKDYSLVELMEKKPVLETLQDYAESGAAIIPASIKSILDNAQLNLKELDAAYEHMQTGMCKQLAKGQGVSSVEYFQAMNYVAGLISIKMTSEDAALTESDGPLKTIKSELVKAHSDNSKESLEGAIHTFKRYALKSNPMVFGPERTAKRKYDVSAHGDIIPVHEYMMGINATDDLQIKDKSTRKLAKEFEGAFLKEQSAIDTLARYLGSQKPSERAHTLHGVYKQLVQSAKGRTCGGMYADLRESVPQGHIEGLAEVVADQMDKYEHLKNHAAKLRAEYNL